MTNKQEVAEILEKELKGKLNKEEIENLIEIPPNSEMGDFAFPCFSLAKIEKKSPLLIAENLKEKIKLTKNFQGCDAKAGYLNFFINKSILADDVISVILKEKENFGKGKEKGKVALEHTSLNPNSSPHLGRARNSIIGDSLKRILEFQGFDVETYYYVNDVSKQIAILALEFKGNENFEDLLELYVKTNKKMDKNPKLEEKTFELLEKFESGDKKTRELFNKIVKIAVDGQKKILSDFGIEFDKFDYESSYVSKTGEILKELEKTGKMFKDEEGRLVLNQEGFGLEEKMKKPYLVLTRSNGTALYVLRDLAYTLDKLERCKKTYLVLGEDQKLYFEQLKTALKMMKKPAPEIIHYSYVLLQNEKGVGKMSTRKGEVVLLEDFMKEAREKAKKEIKKRETGGDAKKIADSAVKYAIIKVDSDKNIIFNLSQALEFEGNTGPYLEYSYARASSIIKKVKKPKKGTDKEIDMKEQEIELIKKLGDFPETARRAYEQLSPNLIANYAYELSQQFNEFYHACPVLGSEEESFRLKLVEAFRIVLKKSLNLLGIEEVEEM